LLRSLSKIKFRLLGLRTIKNIPTEQFNEIIQNHINDNWIKTYEYSCPDAWLDWGCVKLKKNGMRLKFEWDNWTEGSIEGKPIVLEEIARLHGLKIEKEWRWSEYDSNQSVS